MVENSEQTKVGSTVGGAALGAGLGTILGGPLLTIAGAAVGAFLGPKYLEGVTEKATKKFGELTGRGPRP